MQNQNDQPPTRVVVVYGESYQIDLGGLENLHPADANRSKHIHDELIKSKCITPQQFLKPEMITNENLLLIHTQPYLDSLRDPEKVAIYLEAPMVGKFAPKTIHDKIIIPFRYAAGGTLLAAQEALKHGIAINLGGGTHHAMPDHGEGFCLFADIPIAIRRLQKENLIKRATVIDVDVHQGNGTAICLKNDDSTYTFSIHQRDIYPIPKVKSDLDIELEAGTGDKEIMTILQNNLPKILDQSNPDIVFIVAGADMLVGDPLAGFTMTPEGLADRDSYIVDTCVSRNLPVVITIAGGYRKDAFKAQAESYQRIIKKYGLAQINNSNDH